MHRKGVAISIVVALLVIAASTATVHTSNPAEPRSPRVRRYEPIEPIPLEPAEPLSLHLPRPRPRLRLLRAHHYEPMEWVPLKPIEPAIVHPWEPLELRAREGSAYAAGTGNQGASNHPRTITTTCTVTTPADSGPGSLRQCLSDVAEDATIDFDPQVFPPAAPATITLSSPLPWITTDGVTVDGSEAGVVLDGSGLSEGDGLVIDGAHGVTIRGLQILNFPQAGIALIRATSNAVIGGDRSRGTAPLGQGNLVSHNRDGIWLEDTATSSNQVLGNFIGTDATGTRALGNSRIGVFIGFGAGDNVIGGDTAGARNLISGNGDTGVWLQEADTTGNQVLGNFIGTDATGTTALGNSRAGVYVGGASNNVIGGDTPSARNVISGNGEAGVRLQEAETTGTQVLGNYIGTDAAGTASLGNNMGVVLSGVKDNVVGGNTEGARNVISGNTDAGIQIQGDGATGNQVLGNYIGTDATGVVSLENAKGILIGFGASDNIIGGYTAGAHNVISGNADVGIQLQDDGTAGNRILGNYIGTDATGMTPLGNDVGITIGFGAKHNMVGNDAEVTRNVISGNEHAVQIQDEGTAGNQVVGNYIGTDATGMARLGNDMGIVIRFGAKDNVVGGNTEDERNIISGNAHYGVIIQDAGTTGNQVLGNYIGTDATGTQPLANDLSGVAIIGGASDNVIGGSTPNAGNVISGNEEAGVHMAGEGTSGNRVQGNHVGTDASGQVAIPNVLGGIGIGVGATDNVIGGETPGTGNLISGNSGDGIEIAGTGADENRVQGNLIGTDVTGTRVLGNTNDGVSIGFGASNNVIGGHTSNARNLISGNGKAGVWLQGANTIGNQILGNYIGTDAAGARALGNNKYGVFIGSGANNNVIGGEIPGTRNIISGNGEAGVMMQRTNTTSNQVLGNYIGTDATGRHAVDNMVAGVVIGFGASNNAIGGHTSSARNLISGNGRAGVWLERANTTGNQVLGNYIGTDMTGTTSLANVLDGVVIAFGASDNVIGGDSPGARNVISGNGRVGVWLQNADTRDNQVLGNYIGTDATGAVALGNGLLGVGIAGAKDNVVGGDTAGARNVISGNAGPGVQIQDDGTTGNRVIGNYIGTDVTGMSALGNGGVGVAISLGASENVIGGHTPGARNLISGNGEAGVWLQHADTAGNQVQGNYIGTDVLGKGPVPNVTYGVHLEGGASSNTIGPNNTIAYNGGAGVVIDGETGLRNTITRTSIHHNGGLPIDWINVPVPIGPFAAPTLTGYSPADNTLSGSACAGCRVEVFANPSEEPAGTIYLDAVTADANGDFTLTLAGPPPLLYLAATATDLDGTTTEFSPGLRTVPVTIYLPIVMR